MVPRTADCIAAIATPPGEGAIAIVRLSGAGSLEIADRVFRGNSELGAAAGYTVHLGKFVQLDGEVLDEGLATVFRAPRSYTGEDSVEFSCHGGLYVARSVLAALLDAGARQADPGEFTRRAFLNGKMDLSQAEAVAELIASGSRRARRISVDHLEGKLGRKVNELREELLSLCALLEIDLDFAEEGIELTDLKALRDRIGATERVLRELADSFKAGRVYRNGISVVLAGKPNAGKSSLFNALLKEERSIVTPVPGTTRDTIEESITVDGILFRVTDTAGLREVPDVAEAEGVRRARSTARAADVVVLVMDAADDREPAAQHQAARYLEPGQKLIVVLNKADLIPDRGMRDSIKKGVAGTDAGLFTSAVSGEGIHELRAMLRAVAFTGLREPPVDATIMNERQFRSLEKALEALGRGREAVESGRGNEFVALDVRQSVSALAEITGEITSEDVLNSIFSRFCIGK